jgi:membrane-associated phospholipid phosphatase
VAIATLIASGMVARQGLPRWESRAYRRINDAPDSLAPLAWPPMQAGSLSAPFVVAAATFWRTRRVDPAASFAIAGFAAWLTAKVVKKVVGRGRPFDFDETTNLRLWTETDGSLGFVSGHAAVAFAVAGIARQHGSRPLALGAYGLAVVVCVTRIYVGAHLPLDTVGGAALGVIASETTGPVAGAIESALRTASE